MARRSLPPTLRQLVRLGSVAARVIAGGSVVFTASTVLGGPVLLCQSSMEPTLRSGQWVWAKPYSIMWGDHKLVKGDIVIAKHPEDPNRSICKRVKAVSGETVSSRSFHTPDANDSVTPKKSTHLSVQVVPDGHVWLEGDNRADSVDSRVWGPLPAGLVEGRVAYTAFPFTREGIVRIECVSTWRNLHRLDGPEVTSS